ncbi:unnamed protein product, partial [marine sediment metagenome]
MANCKLTEAIKEYSGREIKDINKCRDPNNSNITAIRA